MRALLRTVASVALVCASAPTASAQDASAGGWLGVGMFGDDPTTTVDVGLDVEGDWYAFGVGGRVRHLAGEGIRSEDWDEASEIAGLIRYLTLVRESPVRASLAVGELGGVVLGNGAVVDRYASGLDVDHGHQGAQLRVVRGPARFEAVIDDVVRPRIIGARGSLVTDAGVEAGASAVVDLSAPSMDGPSVVPIVAGDVAMRAASDDDQFRGRLYSDVVAIVHSGAGLHLGAGGSVALGETGARLGARGEARLGTAGYLPGWVGPLYERTRADRLDRAADIGAGVGGLFELSVEVDRAGALTAGYASRPGLPRLATAGLRAPYYRGLQAALWAAAEIGGADPARGMAFEARARLPEAMFLVVESARLYRRDPMTGWESIWIATAAVGAVLGE